VEARVYARYARPATKELAAAAGRIALCGTLRGPYCERSRTLAAEFAFRERGEPGTAEAIVPDPCIWSPELPHFYQADIEARQGRRVVAEYHGKIGLRRGKK
jgi:hypothetical protein